MHGTTARRLLFLALIAALTLVPTTSANAAVATFAPTAAKGNLLVFDVAGLSARDVRAARLVVGRRSWRLRARTVRRGVRKGRVKARAPRLRRSELRKARLSVSTRGKGGGKKNTPPPPDDGTTTPPPPDTTLGLRPPGSPPLSDTDAAALVTRSTWEPRPGNATANARRPTSTELSAYRTAAANWGNCNGFHGLVTGNFSGTTDEIIQWAAAKWGFEAEALRAVATVESRWYQSAIGDGGISYGLMQVKSTVHTGTFPLSRDSTAFNADFYAAMLRYYFDGCATWLNTVERGATYAAGDFWGSVGAWYAGRWHTAAAEGYITKVKTELAARSWLAPGF